jgi:L-aspartate oxidase
VRELIDRGAQLRPAADGRIALTREGGHHRDRIVHAGGDATGAEISRALLARLVSSCAEIEVVEHALVLDLLRDAEGRAAGLTLHVMGEGARDGVGAIRARAVVLATGGHRPGLSRSTTNPSVATGDGVALALRAGAACADLEFVQFHPTVLWLGPRRAASSRWSPRRCAARARSWSTPRASASCRAARAGRPRAARHRGQGDHAPDAMETGPSTCGSTPGTSARTSGGAASRRSTDAALSHGIDPVRDLIPVAPAATTPRAAC